MDVNGLFEVLSEGGLKKPTTISLKNIYLMD